MGAPTTELEVPSRKKRREYEKNNMAILEGEVDVRKFSMETCSEVRWEIMLILYLFFFPSTCSRAGRVKCY